MKKNGVYFQKKEEEEKKEPETGVKQRKNLITALIFVALTIAGVFIYIVVRSKGIANMVPFLLILAVVAVSIEAAWAEPDRKAYVLWKKLFNKE